MPPDLPIAYSPPVPNPSHVSLRTIDRLQRGLRVERFGVPVAEDVIGSDRFVRGIGFGTNIAFAAVSRGVAARGVIHGEIQIPPGGGRIEERISAVAEEDSRRRFL